MLAAVIRFSLTQRLFVGILVLAVMALGARAWLNLPVDAFPDISPTQVKIILKAPGMTAEEVEQQVTQVIETELLGIPDQQMLRSTTKYAITDITLDFREGTDIYWARQQVNERLANVRDSLPDGISGGVAPMSTPLSEMFMFTVENPRLSLMERRHLLDWEIRPALRTVAGVADVNVLGGYARTYQVSPLSAAMAQAGVSMAQLEQAIRDNNLNLGAGRLEQGNDTLIVRTEGRIDNLEQLANLVVKVDGPHIYRLADVAAVGIGHLARYGAVTRDGEETTEALIIALKNSNTAQVVAGVKRKLAELEPTLPAGTVINVFYDRATLIDTAIHTISSALFEAILIVVVLLAVFLGNIRAALVVSLSLPLAALATFYLMSLAGLSANLMSLGGLVIAIGMIVDSSVVVVENVVTRLEGRKGLPRLHLIYRACKDVAVPVVSGTVIVLIVFSPLLTLTGLEGKLFTPVAITIVFAMFSALVLALTVVPIIASLLLTADAGRVPRWVLRLQVLYQGSLERVIARPRYLLLVFAVLLVVSGVMFNFTGKTFMPVLDEGDIIVQLEKSPTISLAASVALDEQIERALLERVPEIRQIVARTGSDEIGLDPMGLNETDVFMELKPASEWRFASKAALIDDIRQVLLEYPGINFGFTQPIQMRISEMLTGSSGDLSIKIFGSDITQLARLADEIAGITRGIPGSVDVQTATIDGGRFLSVDVRSEVARRFGMSTAEFAEYLRTQLEGARVSEIIEGKKRTPIVFATDPASPQALTTVNALEQKVMVMPDGSQAPLYELAQVSFREGPFLVERERGNRFAVVTSNVVGRDIVGYVDELTLAIGRQLTLPTGYSVEFGGEFENQQRATRNLLLVVPAALLLITIILFTTFGSMARAALILGNIPFAIMGGLIALFVTGQYLSVPASVGLIALLGVAVLNGVVMVSYFELTRLSERDIARRIIQGSVRRLRPVLMTASTAMFGLLPLAFATGPGAEIQKPLAIVVIGGLFSSTVTTLYLLPLFYYYMEKRSHG
ncbi:MAG: efflux RND transporter permease subunit [Pseudomonadales bacterium]|nr:efflux RND transporter permease subunit [Halioglobus sp.]MCP5121833.1 efflux RND transporter permease subunit [Pseudomonadales bacterium]MCP5192628.1 efflux RND transporter permease subunit [Pseudomonadales bacterium]